MITRTRHGWGLLLAGVLAAALVGCGGGSDETGEEDAGQSESESQGSAGAGAETLGTPEPAGIDSDLAGPLEINGYVARVVADEGQGAQRVEVRRRGRVVWSRQGYRFAFASGSESRGSFEQGADATGDGGPNLIIRGWTGEGDVRYRGGDVTSMATRALATWRRLLELGVYTNLMMPPASPDGSSLLRCSASAAHTAEQIDAIVDAFRRAVAATDEPA